MLYKALLHLHNLTWWIILFTGLWAVAKTWRGTLAAKGTVPFLPSPHPQVATRRTPQKSGQSPAWTKAQRLAGLVFSSALAAQLLIGLALYFNSDVAHRFFAGGTVGPERSKAVFFGLMHPLAMFTAVVLGQVGYSVSKRLRDDRTKYRAAVFCYTAALAIVLLSVPWPFLSYGRSLMP